MNEIRRRVRSFFFPEPGTRLLIRLLPYLTLGALTFIVLVAAAYAWDYTNSPQFCGTVCHTMPPEYTAYLVSPHARSDCVECHIGRGFIATRITRKAGDIKHVIATAFKTYEFPIRADDLRPARETCERCHFPEKFSDDSLREIQRFGDDPNNTPSSIYLTLKTGGGTKRLGLGRGIHWHIENQVYFLALDPEEQEIPYIQVVEDDGSVIEFVEIGADIDPQSIDPSELKLMDCITCHNRITHLIDTPESMVDQLLARGVISPTIPEIRRKAVEAMREPYTSNELAIEGIADLEDYYQTSHPDFYASNEKLIQRAITALQDAYTMSVFPEQKVNWDSHLDNIGHTDSPGCFRCHDGEHLNEQQEAIRLECNLCHSIPVVAGPSDFVANIEISRGPEPQSHFNPNWIGLHRDVLDASCENCHTTGDPGGISNTSFCSNSACHGSAWEYAGFNAPGLREILSAQLPAPSEPETPIDLLTFNDGIGPLLTERCGGCHGTDGIQGLDLTTYESVMFGGLSGPGIVPGDTDASLIILKLTADQPHFAQLTPNELDQLIDWINAGAPEE